MATSPKDSLLLHRLVLDNIRCFEHVEIDFTDDETGSSVPWTLILGENGSGKSSLLRSIALAAASPKEARGLFETDDRSEWLRQGESEGGIELEMIDARGKVWRNKILISRASYGESIADIQTNRRFDLPSDVPSQPFLCGYGATRSGFGADSPRRYSLRDAVATLFDTDAILQNPELILRRWSSVSGALESELLPSIDRLLTLPEGSTRLGIEGLEIQGPWGTFLPVHALSDGYRSVLAWILDMLGWSLLNQQNGGVPSLDGIVLVDEIEQHLHPSWQRRVIGLLRKQFPGLQVIATTHSPLCVTGATDLTDSEVNLAVLRWAGDHVEARGGLKPPRGQRADQVLTSYFFGLETTSDDRTKHQVQRLSELLSRGESASEGERHEIKTLRAELQAKLGTPETDLERQVSRRMEQSFDDTLGKALRNRLASRAVHTTRGASSLESMGDADDFEARRQLKALLE